MARDDQPPATRIERSGHPDGIRYTLIVDGQEVASTVQGDDFDAPAWARNVHGATVEEA